LAFFEAIIVKAFLATWKRLGVASAASVIGIAIGLPAVAIGSRYEGVPGALGGLVLGLAVRIVIEVMVVSGLAAKLDPVT